jgi:hypothetical protein
MKMIIYKKWSYFFGFLLFVLWVVQAHWIIQWLNLGSALR